MKVSNALYTYPVLSAQGLRDDYISDSYFSSSVEKSQTGVKETSLNVTIELIDSNLLEILKRGDAKIVCHLESPLTSYRTLLDIDAFDMHTSFAVEPRNMRGTLEVTAFIVAVRPIDNFTSETFSDLYEGVYKLESGDMLAFAPTVEVQVEPEDIDKRPTQSIIKISGHDRREMTTDLTGEYILVRIPEETYVGYKMLSSKNSAYYKISLMAVVMPALMDAIYEMKHGDGDLDTRIWARVIRAKLKAGGRGSDPAQYDALLHAQYLLNNPADGTFTPIIDDFHQQGDE